MHFEMHGDRFDSKLSYNVRGRALPRKKHEFRCSSTPKPSTPQSWLASRHRWANSGKPRPRGDMRMGRRSEVRKVGCRQLYQIWARCYNSTPSGSRTRTQQHVHMGETVRLEQPANQGIRIFQKPPTLMISST